MISKFALLGTLLLSSSALADHPSQPGALLVRRDENPQSQSLGRVESRTLDTSNRWGNLVTAGSQLTGKSFNSVGATVTIPPLNGSDGLVLISIGLDTSCESGSLQLGMQGNISGGVVSWDAWSQWLPNPRIDLDIIIRPGDVMVLTILVASLTMGVVILENWSAKAVALQEFNTTDELCANFASWTVQVVVDQNAKMHPLANFGSMTFADAMATASGSDDTYLPSGPSWYTLYEIDVEETCVVNVNADKSTLTIWHA